MNDPRKPSSAFGVVVFIVVVVLLVIGTVLFNAIRGKREHDEAFPPQTSSEAVSDAPASTPAK
ncbi:MAG: hypothetical protein EPN70_11115 [Paraburkholderia sp.]|uniref:hypothetical protein n=1 Tax=Paraburkholderia sp. TaxID=1926495 RepID=UPI00120CFEAA|nr:hypothetical protein [Paraburkholderia sp.]TAM04615.1 MAG: hypothetical protein EPN70_11115 [Paraburkholderia sp.]TAM31354.1 MAG: hypothetical protein EPN59_06675 [Paraburkholderia sp.]